MNMNDIYGILSIGVCALLCVGFLIGLYLLVKSKAPETLVWLNHGFSFLGVYFALDLLGVFRILI